ncbi:MAG: heparinase II/III family protein, partial [Opitutales bacterium]
MRVHSANDWAAPGRPRPALKVGEFLPPRRRTPQFPLKDRRTLFSDAAIAQARANVAQYPKARALADKILGEANYWVTWDDMALRDLLTCAEVPRAVDCCPAGCPVHGKAIFEATGSTYPWIIDPKKPFVIKCPVGGETYPGNDYGRFYRSGFKDRSDFDVPYADDGRGWVGPDGERYWFVAHANHWMWFWHPQADHPAIVRALEFLREAWLLTGDRRYAHKLAVILRRLAEVYPNMDYESQSRYGALSAATHNERYTGKVVNGIWETYFSAHFALAYDAVWETIDDDAALQQLFGETGPALRAFIEAHLLEDAIDAIYEVRSRGNYGMHQRALLILAIVRQHGDNERYLRDVLDRPTGAVYLGLRHGFFNLIWPDGNPYESPGYNFHWVSNLAEISTLLPLLGVGADRLPRLRRLFDAPLDQIVVGRFTPAIGDSLTAYGGLVPEEARIYQCAWRAFGDPRHAAFLAGLGCTGEAGFTDFDSLLHPLLAPGAVPPAGRVLPPQPSRLIAGYGLSILNDPADTTAVTVYHGLHVNHVHFDRLNLELFAHGQPLLPDLGYPDAMNEYVPGIYTWSLTTISHNTVTVDAATQPGNAPGIVELQADAGWVRAVAVNAPGTYPQCDTYRRTVVMIDTGVGRHYAVDVFEVAGGRQHDYSLHGPPGEFRLTGDWTEPAPGTLAGPNVAVGEIYDDPVLGAKDYKGGYIDYRGSGFQHLTQVRRHRAGDWVADYTHEKDPQARLRVRVLPATGQEMLTAQARISPVKFPQLLNFLIDRRSAAADAPLASRFASVIEPHADGAFIVEVARHELPAGVALVVTRAGGETDVIVVNVPGEAQQIAVAGHTLQTDGRVTVATLDAGGTWRRWWQADGT